MKYKCTKCGFETETEGTTILNFDAKCPECKKKGYAYERFSYMNPIDDKKED